MPVINVEGFESCECHHIDLLNLYECEIGEGTKIGTFVEIGAGVTIGKNCKIQSFAFIPPGVVLGDDVFVGPHVCFCNTKHPMTGEKYLATIVQDGAVIGAGAVILPGIIIGTKAVVGAGSVVTRNVGVGETVLGNPAQPYHLNEKLYGPPETFTVDRETVENFEGFYGDGPQKGL